MSRSPMSPTVRPQFAVDEIAAAKLDGMSGWYIGDVPYLSDGRRVVVKATHVSASTSVVEDRLPSLGALDSADTSAMRVLADHLSRNHDRLAFASIRHGERGALTLHTVLTRLTQ